MVRDDPWSAEIQHIYESIHEITPHDEQLFRDAEYSEERLREAFEEGFLTHHDDPDVTPDERQAARAEFFEWMEYLGYDSSNFDWQEWRDEMGYGQD